MRTPNAVAHRHWLSATGSVGRSLSVQIEAADALLEDGGDIASARVLVQKARRLAVEGLAETRAAVHALRDEPVSLTDQLTALAASDGAEISVEGVARPLPPDAGLAIYRAAQEALSNARKHAPGAPVSIRLHFLPDTTELTVTNGPTTADAVTTELSRSGSGLGLQGMQERIELLGGQVRAAPRDRGWQVQVALPT